MSDHQHENAVPAESRSRMKLVRNAKGDTQIDVSIVEGTTSEEADRIREIAVAQYKALQSEFYGSAGAVA